MTDADASMLDGWLVAACGDGPTMIWCQHWAEWAGANRQAGCPSAETGKDAYLPRVDSGVLRGYLVLIARSFRIGGAPCCGAWNPFDAGCRRLASLWACGSGRSDREALSNMMTDPGGSFPQGSFRPGERRGYSSSSTCSSSDFSIRTLRRSRRLRRYWLIPHSSERFAFPSGGRSDKQRE
jgi:hypothetical protein